MRLEKWQDGSEGVLMGRRKINKAVFRDKVMGCWLGKNAGGTLGEPMEGKFGQTEMFHLDWYPSLPEGGIPNDDLELQLIWLQLIQQKGPGITAADFVEAWTDCIAYNFDEYGLSKENMQKGLLPPVCGWNNNAFRDCMGSPIRSEIWACLAPGCPQVAAWYAYQDAIVDHGGGESVYGEIFNAVLESAAFVCGDKFELLKLALSAIPKESLTYQCVSRSIRNYHSGMGYEDNRNDLVRSFYHPVAQYSPLNLGFQTIGWLYGRDFGDAICKAVNCGWDTDCTAATLGAILGILKGASALPEKWLVPLGYEVATNMTTGGIRNLTAPIDIRELTEQVCGLAEEVTAYWNCDIAFTDEEGSGEEALQPIEQPWLLQSPNEIRYRLGGLEETIIYGEDAAILGDRTSRIGLRLKNPHPVEKKVKISMVLPEGFTCEEDQAVKDKKSISLKPWEAKELFYNISAGQDAIQETNRGFLLVEAEEEPALPAVPLVLLGGSKWLISPLFADKTLEEDCGIPEDRIFSAAPAGFRVQWNPGNDLRVADRFTQKGVVYALHHIYSQEDKDVVLGVPNNGRMRLFLNGELIHETKVTVPLRANLGNGGALGDLSNYQVSKLQKGWNQILIKLEMVMEPQEAHFTLGGMSKVCYKNHGMPVLHINRSRFEWEV